jgi:hypothetical protein
MTTIDPELLEPQVAGKVGPHRESHESRLHALDFLAAGVTPISGFIKFDLTAGQTAFGMACNGQLGCCGFSAWQHLNALLALLAGDANWMQISLLTWCPNFETLPPAYYAYGIAQGEPGPHPDDGVDNASMLAWAYKLGLIDGYFEVPMEYADWFTATFNGSLIGQVLDGPTAIANFNATPRVPWDTMPKTDGHDTAGAAGDGEGGGLEITWGGLQPYTPGYRANNWTDVWVIVDKDDTNINYEALKAVLTEMHGIVNPVQGADATADPAGFIERIGANIERDLKSLYHAVPDETKDFVKEIHKLIDAALEHEGVQVLEKIFSDALAIYTRGKL